MQIQRHHFAGLPNKQGLSSWGSIFGVTIVLIGMMSLWIAIILWAMLGWSIHRERSGHASLLWQSIPQQSKEIQIIWGEKLDQIEITLSNHEHTWIKIALIQWGISALGLLCTGLGVIPAALACTVILPCLFLRPSEAMPTQSTEFTGTQRGGLQIIADRTCNWYAIHHCLTQHQNVLPNTGTFIISQDDTRQPFLPPTYFSNWTLSEVSSESQ